MVDEFPYLEAINLMLLEKDARSDELQLTHPDNTPAPTAHSMH